ncbi:MAG TPA: FecR family protein [Draconibacterium sp.]|nr:FecR family protein [Draconibacterium sp.]
MTERNNSSQQKISPAEFGKMSPDEKILKFTEGFETPAGMPKNEALNKVLSKIENGTQSKTRKLTYYLRAAAAVAILILGIYGVSSVFSKSKMVTEMAQQTTFSLPDKSVVVMNADSKITWNNRKFNDSRNLRLNGEAYFDVQKGNKFVIETKNGTVEVLGTQLNVFSRNNEFRVSCISGKVRVASNTSEQIILPGETAELTTNGITKSAAQNPGKIIAWQQGIFYFEDKPVVSIFAELERQFNVSIKFNGMEDRYITATFSNKNLKEALDIVCIPMDLKYEIENKTITVYEKPK